MLAGTLAAIPWIGSIAAERVDRIAAKRFEYLPPALTIPAGKPVVIEITVSDVPMGFNLPDLKLRADLIPGQPARIRIPPQPAGELSFYCDIFCGSGHEDMNGTIHVAGVGQNLSK